jgi:hypothetical protein
VSSEIFQTYQKNLRLEIDAAGQGTLLVGAAPLPPPTDPNVGSPPEAQADAAEASGLLLHLYEGATYSTKNVQVSGASYSFAVDMIEAFEPWCAIQTPILTSEGTEWRCRENWAAGVHRENGKQCYQRDPATGIEYDEDCLAVFLCSVDLYNGCQCTASGCTAGSKSSTPPTVPISLELADEGAVLRGGLQWLDGNAVVELWRQPEE